MTLRYLLDTNVCIRVLRDRPSSARGRFNAEAGGLCISTVVLLELLRGAAKSANPVHNRDEVERFAARLEVLAFDADAAAHAADIRVELESRGEAIGPYDSMIVGHARSRGLTVITVNHKEFRRVSGLRCEGWLD